jgi:hypothetical protein
MIAAIQITWKQIRLDLHGDEEALRAERLAFITDALKLKRPVESLRDLSTPQLARVLDAMRRFQSQPRLEGYAPPVKAEPAREEAGANVVHLASAEQVFTINNLLTHLDWTREYQEDFLHRRFGRKNPAHMRPPQAQSLTRILLNIACTRELKKRGVKKVSRAMIREEIPYLKASLGIDRRHQATDTDEGGNTWQ